MKLSEMRSVHVSELEKRLAETKAELAKERAVVAGGTRPEKPGKIRTLRRSIARMLTIMNERERAAGKTFSKVAEYAAVKAAVAEKPVSREAVGKDAKAFAVAAVEKEAKAVLHKEKKVVDVKKVGEKKKPGAEGKISQGFLPQGNFPKAFLRSKKGFAEGNFSPAFSQKAVAKQKAGLKKQAKKGKR